MSSGSFSIIANVYSADFSFVRPITGFDFFRISGLTEKDRFMSLGKVVDRIQFMEKQSFAQYTPSPTENYVVGYIPTGRPRSNEYKVDGLSATYIGKGELPPTQSSRRALTALLNKIKANELRRSLWSSTGHSFYPKKGEDLNGVYNGCGLTLFRGPSYRYNVMDNGSIILSLDSTTHYTRSEPFLSEINRSNLGDGKINLEWFVEQIKYAKKQAELRRRKFAGLHFFYNLLQRDVAIDDVDPRPISEIPLPESISDVNGIRCKTVAEYLRAKYSSYPAISKLDDRQPGLKGNGYTYAPQFLFQTVPLDDIPDHILNNETFFMDRNIHGYRDNQKPAESRWEIIENYFDDYNFGSVDLGPIQFRMRGPLEFPLANHFEMPKLKTGGQQPVTPKDIETALRDGLFRPPRIGRIYIYSQINSHDTATFYNEMKAFAKEKYAVRLPDRYIPLEGDIPKMTAQLENSLQAGGRRENPFLVGIIDGRSTLYETLTNICGEYKVPSKMVTAPVAKDVCRGAKFYLRDTLASMFTRAGGVPWILHDKLHYDCYTAVDVGRSMSEWWAMGIVYDKNGSFTVRQGKMNAGEDLDEQSIRHCISQANAHAPQSNSIIYLRDGDVFETERRFFEKVIESFPAYSTAAMVSLKKSGPYRIFRSNDARTIKPLSGDYYFLDDNYAVVCGAGGDEYRHGTPQPFVAEVIPVKGEVNPLDVIEDTFKLTYLNFGSPGRSYSIPAPVRLAHDSATELSMGIRRHGGPF